MAKYPPPSPKFIGARHHGGRQNPEGIVIHGTVSSDNRGTARNIAEWWHGPTSPVTSCHYVVDPGAIAAHQGPPSWQHPRPAADRCFTSTACAKPVRVRKAEQSRATDPP